MDDIIEELDALLTDLRDFLAEEGVLLPPGQAVRRGRPFDQKPE